MTHPAARQALRHYARIGTHSEVEFASPHRLIQMLMEGGLSRLSAAAGHMRRGQIAEKGACLGLAISIVSGLQASLDEARGGEVAANLDRLYDYMVRTLVIANLENDVAKVEEVQRLLGEIKAGWDGITDAAAEDQPVPGTTVAATGSA